MGGLIIILDVSVVFPAVKEAEREVHGDAKQDCSEYLPQRHMAFEPGISSEIPSHAEKRLHPQVPIMRHAAAQSR